MQTEVPAKGMPTTSASTQPMAPAQGSRELLEAAVRESLDQVSHEIYEVNRGPSFQEMLHRVETDGQVTAAAPPSGRLLQPGWSVEQIIAKAVEIENASSITAAQGSVSAEKEIPREAAADELARAFEFAAALAHENNGLMVDLTPPQVEPESGLDRLAMEYSPQEIAPEWARREESNVRKVKGPTSAASVDGSESIDEFAEIPFEIVTGHSSRQTKNTSLPTDSLDEIERLMQEVNAEVAHTPAAFELEHAPASEDPLEIPWSIGSSLMEADPMRESPATTVAKGPKSPRSTAANHPSFASIPDLSEAVARARREPLLWQGFRNLGNQIDHDLPSRGTGSMAFFGVNKESHVTDTALQFAYFQAEEAMRKVVLVDGNFGQKSLSLRLGIEAQFGFGELIAQVSEWDRVTYATPHERLFVIGVGQRGGSETIDEVAILSVVMELSNNFDLVVIDAGEAMAAAFPSIYNACDCSYLIARLARTPRDTLQRVTKKLRDSNLIPSGCIVTNAPPTTKR